MSFKLVTRFSSSESTPLQMSVWYGSNIGVIQYNKDDTFYADKPLNMPMDLFLRCMYRFNRVLSQMIKPIDDGN